MFHLLFTRWQTGRKMMAKECELDIEALELLYDECFRCELQEMNSYLERIAIILEKIGETKGIITR